MRRNLVIVLCLSFIIFMTGCSEHKNKSNVMSSSDTTIYSSANESIKSAEEPPEYKEAYPVIKKALEDSNYENEIEYLSSEIINVSELVRMSVNLELNEKEYTAVCLKVDNAWNFISLKDIQGKDYYGDDLTTKYIDLYDINTGKLLSQKQEEMPTYSDISESANEAYSQITNDAQNQLNEFLNE